MPKSEFPLEPGGPKRIGIEWRGMWKDFTVRFDGQIVGQIPDSASLKAGRSLALPDQSTLWIQLRQGFANTGLEISRNGQPLPGSSTDPEVRVRVAAAIVYVIGALSMAAGAAAAIFKISLLLAMGLGWESAAFGSVYLVLGFLVGKRHSAIALAIAVALFALDGLYSFYAAIQIGASPPVGGLIFRGLLLASMVRGFSAIRLLKNIARNQPPSTGVGEMSRAGEDPFEPPSH